MFKLDRKSLASISLIAAVSIGLTACFGEAAPSSNTAANASVSHVYANGKAVIDGGVTYPVVNGETSVYRVNTDTLKGGYTYGRKPTKNELDAWATSVTPFAPPPEGSGSVSDGSDLYDAKCVMCHGDFGSGGGGYPALAKGNAYKGQKTLKNQRTEPGMEGPQRVFGTYWPQASTLWWYIKEGMPHPAPKSLTDDEVYALVAYILNINEMKIDGKPVDDDYVLDREKFMKIVMPNQDGFVPKIDGPHGTDNARAFFNDPKNIGAQTVANRCMKDCIKGDNKVTHIKIETKDFLPPMSVARDLPAQESKGDANAAAKKAYEESCKMCHGADGMGAPVFGNKKEWAPFLVKGIKEVYKNGINGINGMPPKGGTSLSDKEFEAVVDYMVNASK
ncbi:c-type cytochrome [Sulfurimonas sp. HSL-1716]|uniref:c-type cytochrome n=1 Tax=Hydrocurvibacter sulfurireducens TaxID=3131937 RepID=UPI0031F922B4